MSTPYSKSPIIYVKMMFSGTKLSDFMKLNPDIAKTACNEAVFKNGAADKKVLRLTAYDISAVSQKFARRCRFRTYVAPVSSFLAIDTHLKQKRPV